MIERINTCSDDINPINVPCNKDLSRIQNDFIRLIDRKQTEMLTQVMKDVLGRDLTTDDGHRFSIIYMPLSDHYMDYDLAFDGKKIMEVRFTSDGTKATISFTPIPTDTRQPDIK